MLAPDELVRKTPLENFMRVLPHQMGVLSPDSLVRVTPLENVYGCSPTLVGESDSTRKLVESLSPNYLVRKNTHINFVVESLLSPTHLVGEHPHQFSSGVSLTNQSGERAPLFHLVKK